MLVGWGSLSPTQRGLATFSQGTLGTVSAYFQSADQSWQLAGSQYPNGAACKSTEESTTGLLWTVPTTGPLATFGTADQNRSGAVAQGIIFVPGSGIDLSTCHP
jgi:hypothetical protein